MSEKELDHMIKVFDLTHIIRQAFMSEGKDPPSARLLIKILKKELKYYE